jgi:mRNA interferase MazF
LDSLSSDRRAYSDPDAAQIQGSDFAIGSLHRIRYARPGKIFTAPESLIASQVGMLKDDAFRNVAHAVIHLLQPSIPP